MDGLELIILSEISQIDKCNWWMKGKAKVLYIYNRVFFSFKNEGNSDIYYNVDESWKNFVKPVTEGQIQHDSTYMTY